MATRNKWPVADLHCDALSKLAERPELDFAAAPSLDVSAERMRRGGIQLQCFAVFVNPTHRRPGLEHALAQIERYRRQVIEGAGLRPLLWREEALELESEKGRNQGRALLSLEGADSLEGQLFYAELLFELGVRLLGLTWNYANWAADGIWEERGGGLTDKGRQLVDWCNESGMLLDVSHLSEQGFWELAERSDRPFIASHSNARAVCDHRRNLRDEQIEAIAAQGGLIGLNFYPWFVRADGHAAIEDLIPHIERICERGGAGSLSFGSDFDGIDAKLRGLEHSGRYPDLLELLLGRYTEAQVRDWSFGNAARFMASQLPPSTVN